MTSTPKSFAMAQSTLMPMIRGDDVSVDIRIGRAEHMAFVKADPVAMATFIKDAPAEFQEAFFSAAEKYMPSAFSKDEKIDKPLLEAVKELRDVVKADGLSFDLGDEAFRRD